MAIREDLVSSAVTFLQDPNVSGSPLDNRIAFLQSKNLTQEEVDAALARASGEAPLPPNYSNYPPEQQLGRVPQAGYSGYQQYGWQPTHPPPEVPRRDWRDWFIMATVMGGVGYGAYAVAKRYIYPMIAPPTPPQLEQDKKAIDESFEKAFALLEQLSKDTEDLKAAEQARTERLDTALTEVEQVINELKRTSKQREDESRRVNDEVRDLKNLIPKALEGEKKNTDTRLKELNTEIKSLKTLIGQRMNPVSSNAPSQERQTNPVSRTVNGSPAGETVTPKPASVSSSAGTEAVASLQSRGSAINNRINASRSGIPAWQLTTNSDSSTSGNNANVTESSETVGST